MGCGLNNSKDICQTCAQLCEDCAGEREKGKGDLMQRSLAVSSTCSHPQRGAVAQLGNADQQPLHHGSIDSMSEAAVG